MRPRDRPHLIATTWGQNLEQRYIVDLYPVSGTRPIETHAFYNFDEAFAFAQLRQDGDMSLTAGLRLPLCASDDERKRVDAAGWMIPIKEL